MSEVEKRLIKDYLWMAAILLIEVVLINLPPIGPGLDGLVYTAAILSAYWLGRTPTRVDR